MEYNSDIVDWISSKGAEFISDNDGLFKSKTKRETGIFQIKKVKNKNGSVHEYYLEEKDKLKRIFSTKIFVSKTQRTIVIYVEISAFSNNKSIGPDRFQIFCPKIVGNIINKYDDILFKKEKISIFDNIDIDSISNFIFSEERELPLILVSEVNGEELFKNLCKNLSSRLIGLAHVFKINQNESWELTNKIGKFNSCYNNSVRLYWPRGGNFKLYSLLFSQQKLQSIIEKNPENPKAIFLDIMANLIFDASTISISKPPIIKKILFLQKK